MGAIAAGFQLSEAGRFLTRLGSDKSVPSQASALQQRLSPSSACKCHHTASLAEINAETSFCF